MIARRLIVHGEVQGVFYRNWTVATARELELTGWVRNLRSGKVEIIACGSPDAVETLIQRCRTGPPAARVSGIDVEEAEPQQLSGFEKRPTA